MAVTRKSYSIQFSAAADALAQPLLVRGMKFAGTGLTAGQRLIVKDSNGGAVLVDHFIEAASEDRDVGVITNPYWVQGIYVDTFPASGGTFTVHIG